MAWQKWIAIGCIFSGLGVIFGAFGAHALKKILDSKDLEIFETAVRYQMYHAFGLIVLGLVMTKFASTGLKVSGSFFIIGTILFSGSLYGLVLSPWRWLGAVTPIGGVFFVLAWLTMAASLLWS